MSDSIPWTIRSVPTEVRLKAVNAAKAADQTTGEWITDMVNKMTDRHMANMVLPPDKQEPRPAPPPIDFSGMAAALAAATAAAASQGAPVPKSVTRDFNATFRAQLRIARGLPGRQTAGQTNGKNRQTLSFDLDILPPPNGADHA